MKIWNRMPLAAKIVAVVGAIIVASIIYDVVTMLAAPPGREGAGWKIFGALAAVLGVQVLIILLLSMKSKFGQSAGIVLAVLLAVIGTGNALVGIGGFPEGGPVNPVTDWLLPAAFGVVYLIAAVIAIAHLVVSKPAR